MSGETAASADPGTRLAGGVQLAAFVSLVVSAVLLPVLAGTVGPGFRLLLLAVGIMGAFFWTLAMIFQRRVAVPWGWAAGGGALVLAAGALSAFFADCPQAALMTGLRWLAYASVFALALWIGADPAARRLAVRAMCAIALPIALYGVLQYAVLLDLTREQIEADPAAALRETRMEDRDYDALLRRTTSRRVFSTFALPNSLAGYLLIVLPPSIALLALARRPSARIALGVTVLGLGAGLFLTFSKGGWLAGGCVLLFFLISRGRRWLRRRWPVALAGVLGAAGVLVVALLGSPTLRERMSMMSRELGASARVRGQYWGAGLAMWRGRPLLGVGPGNYTNHYMKHKPATAEEVKAAHNDYVQLLAECGPLALLGYAAFWFFVIRGSLRGRGPPEGVRLSEQANTFASSRAVCLAVLIALASDLVLGRALNLTGSLTTHLVAVVGFAALWWLAFRASTDAMSAPGAGEALRIALGLGLLGFALHSLVDLNLYVEGVGCTAFAAAGLAAAPWARRRDVRLEGGRRILVLLGVAVAGIAVLWLVSRVSEADSYRERAKYLARQPGLGPADLAEIQSALERAASVNPFDDKTRHALGGVLAHRFRARWDGSDFREAVSAWRRAIELNPSSAEYHAHLGELFHVAARVRPGVLAAYLDEYEREAERLETPFPPRRSFLPATVEAYEAMRLAPTALRYRLLLGAVLELGGLRDRATAQFRTALELHDAMVRGGAPARQRLTAAELATVRRKLGLIGPEGGAIIPK